MYETLIYFQILSLSETQLCQLHAHRNLNPNQSSSDADTDADDVNEFRPAVPIAVLSAVYLAKVFCIPLCNDSYRKRNNNVLWCRQLRSVENSVSLPNQ